jgi:hypothetical protein
MASAWRSVRQHYTRLLKASNCTRNLTWVAAIRLTGPVLNSSGSCSPICERLWAQALIAGRPASLLLRLVDWELVCDHVDVQLVDESLNP